jgi:NAD(P)-dependent dehydrogenase (short-subunit alcohol dehydrogenase family)
MSAWTPSNIPDQSGRTFVVTGANSGIGLVTARELARKGASVILACRSLDRGETAAQSLRDAVLDAKVSVSKLDLASLQSIRAFAERFHRENETLDGLINNAGLMALPRTLTEDGFEMQIGTNHLGHFALTGLLLPALFRAKSARIVNVSSQAHRMGSMHFDDLMGEKHYEKWAAYGQSKLCNLLFTYELARRLEKTHPDLRVTAAHPGYSATDLQRKGPEAEGSAFMGGLMKVANALFAQSSDTGALPTLRAATDPDAKSADYFGPRGPFEIGGAPVKVDSNERSHDLESAKKLWEMSEELTKVHFALD